MSDSILKELGKNTLTYVNNELATERGKKIRHGDIVEVKGVGCVEVERDVD